MPYCGIMFIVPDSEDHVGDHIYKLKAKDIELTGTLDQVLTEIMDPHWADNLENGFTLSRVHENVIKNLVQGVRQ